MNSTYAEASRATSQFDERRATPISVPRIVAATMPNADTHSVLSSPTHSARP